MRSQGTLVLCAIRTTICVKEGSASKLVFLQPLEEEEAESKRKSSHSKRNGESEEEQCNKKPREADLEIKDNAKKKFCNSMKKVR